MENATAEDSAPQPPLPGQRGKGLILLVSILFVGGCGLIYELMIATVSSYLLGSSVTQFSIAIGVFIGAMGLGSFASHLVRVHLLEVFIFTEMLLAVVGGPSAALLFWTYSMEGVFGFVQYGTLVSVGALTGLELPLLTRLLNRYGSLQIILAQALSFDYLGALLGSLLFPLLLLPSLGLMRTSFLVGLLNVVVAGWNILAFRKDLRRPWFALALCGGIAGAHSAGLLYSGRLLFWLESRLYQDEIVYSEQTAYQRIVLTRWQDDWRLYLNGHLQFSSIDEHLYHEALVHPALALAPNRERILVLGGGDGLVARELLKDPAVNAVTIVDLDPSMTRLGRSLPALVLLNRGAFHDQRVHVVSEDAFKFLESSTTTYDIILADLPDPSHEVLVKLYSVQFYRLVRRHLSATGLFVTQATSPVLARDAFWCIHDTVKAAGLHPLPYRRFVPSFGDWGFVMAARRPLDLSTLEKIEHAGPLSAAALKAMFAPEDRADVDAATSTLDRPVLLNYYLDQWRQWRRESALSRRS
ncbi:MAG: polyamine aminopropyltransferase [Planctomycetes bacterium]|nr:polyamine aminopropyltransferase [Planctomycetota bacterium]